ncbi:MAG: hypothetical protein HOP18_16790 [Deltaproteobacteria bacterium]|nr:hypothetical protein [Deltaproteobacteria bacterium]
MAESRSRPTQPRLLKMERTESGYLLHLHVPEDFLYFEGHFPEVPIVPGVCQLQWVIDAIQTYTGAPVHLSALENVKFLRPLFPGQSCMLELTYSPQPARWHYRIYTDSHRFASGSLLVKSV